MTQGGEPTPTHRGGRHRAPKPSGSRSDVLVPIGVVVTVLVLLAGGAYVYFDEDSTAGGADPQTPASDTASDPAPDTASDDVAASVVESTRDTNVNGVTVTVREEVSLVEGSDVRLVPENAEPAPGLVWRSSVVSNDDGTTPAFDKPIALTSGGSITIEGTYRLTRCPDLLPTSWPTPLRIVGEDWTRTLTRTQVPLKTARAICPKGQTKAKELRGLSGTMLRSRSAVVRLRWEGKAPLVVNLVGSASEVAVLTRSSACGGECVAQIRRNARARLPLRPVDRCAIGGRSNELTLQVAKPGGNKNSNAQRVVAVTVPGLAGKVCTAARR